MARGHAREYVPVGQNNEQFALYEGRETTTG